MLLVELRHAGDIHLVCIVRAAPAAPILDGHGAALAARGCAAAGAAGGDDANGAKAGDAQRSPMERAAGQSGCTCAGHGGSPSLALLGALALDEPLEL